MSISSAIKFVAKIVGAAALLGFVSFVSMAVLIRTVHFVFAVYGMPLVVASSVVALVVAALLNSKPGDAEQAH